MSEPTPCPICEAPVPADARAFPFCSPRCRLVDLGRWADGRYAIPVPPPEQDGAGEGEVEGDEAAPRSPADEDEG